MTRLRSLLLAITPWMLAMPQAHAQSDAYTWDDFLYEYTTDEEQA